RTTRPLTWLLLVLLLTSCTPAPEVNVLGHLLARRLGTSGPVPITATGHIHGRIMNESGHPIPGATALVALRDGRPFAATSDATGTYTITHVPTGQYTLAAV